MDTKLLYPLVTCTYGEVHVNEIHLHVSSTFKRHMGLIGNNTISEYDYMHKLYVQVCQKRISEAAVRYKQFCDAQVKEGRQRPTGDGVVIFYEAHVVSHLMWNS